MLPKTWTADHFSLPLEIAGAEKGKLGILMVKPCRLGLKMGTRAEKVKSGTGKHFINNKVFELKQ